MAKCHDYEEAESSLKGFFRNISWVPIFAGALAAVTSFLLSAKIGIAGSVIGVAVSSIVTAISSQVYQNVIRDSTKKIQQTVGTGSDEDGDRPADDAAERIDRAADDLEDGGESAEPADKRQPRKLVYKATESGADGESVVLEPGSSASQTMPPSFPSDDGSSQSLRHGSGLSVRQRERDRRKRTAIVVTIASALLAVAATAAVILLVTEGHGTDSVVRDWVSPTPSPTQTIGDDTSRSKGQKTSEPTESATHRSTPSHSTSVAPSASTSAPTAATNSPTASASPTPSASPSTSASGGSTHDGNSGSGNSGNGGSSQSGGTSSDAHGSGNAGGAQSGGGSGN